MGAEVIYPSVGMLLCNYPDIDYQHACFDAYNQWIAEFCATAPDRLIGMGQTAMRTPEEGIADLEAMKALGLRGVMLPGMPPQRRLRRPDVRRVLGRGGRPRAPAVVPHPHEQERRAVRQGARPAAQHVHDDPARATRTSSA